MTGTAPQTATEQSSYQLQFSEHDIEGRLGLPVGRMTNPSGWSGLLLGFLLLAALYVVAWLPSGREGWGETAWRWLTAFQGIPIAIATLTCWSIAIMLLKYMKIRAQRVALSLPVIPKDPSWVLTGQTADALMRRIRTIVDEPEAFMYFRRVFAVLLTIRNVGRVSEVEELFEGRAHADEAIVDSGYSLVKAFIWGVPVLGFIGTVIGLTQATGQFGKVLNSEEMKTDLSKLASGLTEVLGGLDTAFITTAEGLVSAFFLFLGMTIVRQADDRLLDDIRDRCYSKWVTRVRIQRDVQQP